MTPLEVSLSGVSRDSGVMEGAVRKISVAFNLQRLMYVYLSFYSSCFPSCLFDPAPCCDGGCRLDFTKNDGDLNKFVDCRPWVMEGSPCEGEEAAKDPAAKQPPLGELCQPLYLVIVVIPNIGRS